MYHLRILFTCLCAHVEREAEEDVLVILPDARNGCPPMKGMPKPSSTDHGDHDHHHSPTSGTDGLTVDSPAGKHPAGHDMPPHVGVILFDALDLDGDSDVQPHLCYRSPRAHSEYGLYFLTGEDVTVRGAPKGAPRISGGRTQEVVPKGPGEDADVSWIADVSQLDAAAGFIDPACLLPGSAASLGCRARVLTRIRLTGGTLSSALLPRSTQDVPLTFGFRSLEPPQKGAVPPTPPSYKQALSSALAYDLPIDGEKVTLDITPFGEAQRELTFSLAGQPFGHTLQIAFKNMPLDSAIEVAANIDPKSKDSVDEHFAMYYALSERPPATLWVPEKLGDRSGAPICPSARFKKRTGFP